MSDHTNDYIGTDNATQWQMPPINTPEEIAKLQETGVLPPDEEKTDEECVDETDETDETDEAPETDQTDETDRRKADDLESPVLVPKVADEDVPPPTRISEVEEDRRTKRDEDEKDKPVFGGGLL